MVRYEEVKLKLKVVTLGMVLILCAFKVYGGEDYLKAAEGVSFAYGHVQRTGGDMIADPNSETGFRWINTKLANMGETNRIPLKKGHGFHVKLLLFKLPSATKSIQVSMTHPQMNLPTGEVLKSSSFRIPTQLNGAFPEASLSYTLDEDYELVAGDWVVTFTHLGAELFNIKFVTYVDEL